jgi:hypothetical protein
VKDQFSNPYKTRGQVIAMYILIFTFLYSKQNERKLWSEWQQAFPKFDLLLIPL